MTVTKERPASDIDVSAAAANSGGRPDGACFRRMMPPSALAHRNRSTVAVSSARRRWVPARSHRCTRLTGFVA